MVSARNFVIGRRCGLVAIAALIGRERRYRGRLLPLHGGAAEDALVGSSPLLLHLE